MRCLVIVPAYNEEESIVKTINDLKTKTNSKIDYVVVNDGSKDSTLDVLKANNITYLSHIINKGVGASIKTGILYALENGYDYITQFDADGQHNPEYILDMIHEIENGFDIVIGSRFLNTKKPWNARMLGSKVLSNLIYFKCLFKMRITDPTSGQRMMNVDVMKDYLDDASASEPAFAVKYINKGYKVKEIKVKMNEREAGESHFNFINSVFFMMEQTIAILLGY